MVQQGFYTQFMHSPHTNNAEQLVGELWINCSLHKNIPHRDTEPVDMQISVERQPLFYRKWLMGL